MKKLFILALALVATSVMVQAQDPDLEAINKMRKIKADSISVMLGKVYGSQSAMNHATAEERVALLQAFNEVLNLENQDENYKEGNAIASEFFKVAQDMKNRNGINMNRSEFAKAFMARFNDTTVTVPINEMRAINGEASALIESLTALNKDSVAAITQASLIALKNDSLSQNMGRFYGMVFQANAKKMNLNEEQIARFLEGFNNGINVDESNKALVDGRLLGNEFLGIEQNIKKQLNLNLDKDLFKAAVIETLSDPKVPTAEEFQAIDSKAQAYFRETQTFVQENSAEALTQKGLGKMYIENLMEKDPAFIQAPSGLVYKIINPGNGNKFNANDKIKVMYKGTHVDGKTFDESKEPVTFAPNQVVPGFREALLMMSPGAKMTAVLPYNLGYGARGAGQDIKPFETLVFDIETIGLDDTAPEAKPGEISPAETGKATAQPVADKIPATKKATKKAASKKAGKKRK